LERLSWIRQFSESERRMLYSMLRTGRQCPRTSSVGRLFDAVASLLNLRHRNRFEGDAAMSLEFQARQASIEDSYPIHWKRNDREKEAHPGRSTWEADWGPMLRSLLEDLRQEKVVPEMAAKFHNALVECIVSFAERMKVRRVVVSGGCFQNRLLMDKLIPILSESYEFYFPQKVPPNDGGIALGQICAATKDISLL
jgi:hydrogenase maturation protein HypF